MQGRVGGLGSIQKDPPCQLSPSASASIGLATLTAFAIVLVGQTLWGAMAMVNVKLTPAMPWAAAVMPFVLAALVAFLAGRAGRRRRRGPPGDGPAGAGLGQAWAWSLAAGGAAVIAAAALWTVMATIVRVPPNLLPDLKGVPLLTAIPMLLVSIAAAPLSEEIAFRGYAMACIRRRFSPTTALVITSAIFAAAHLTQGLYAPKLIVYFLAGLAFGYVALRTGSLLPAMVAHCCADLTFFTLVWSHDAGRRLISEGGADGWFFANLALLVACSRRWRCSASASWPRRPPSRPPPRRPSRGRRPRHRLTAQSPAQLWRRPDIPAAARYIALDHAAAPAPHPHRIRRRRRAAARPALGRGARRHRRRGRAAPPRDRDPEGRAVPRPDDRQGAAGERRRRAGDRAPAGRASPTR